MRPKSLTVAEIEYAAFVLARKLMTWDEPIPDFGSRFPNILESCLDQPFMRFSRKDLYRGLISKGAILFYLLIKNHPFQNGNKRIAVMSLLYFFHKNGKWLRISNIDLYKFAKHVAKSRPSEREKLIQNIQGLLKGHIIELSHHTGTV